MIAPNRYASQLALPAVPYINGMIRTAVSVGAILATEMAESSVKLRQPALKPAVLGFCDEASMGAVDNPNSGPCAKRHFHSELCILDKVSIHMRTTVRKAQD